MSRKLKEEGISAKAPGVLTTEHAIKVLSDFEASKFRVVSVIYTNYHDVSSTGMVGS